MRVDSAVEPTRSENITVTGRRLAVSFGVKRGEIVSLVSLDATASSPFKCRYRAEH